ncbi:NTTRR-F1 domain [Brevibacillus reuszeri]|uniref:NTTRR-F1 domain n=1 Tax=Brevibacillus reuszeri TaxID=54915 RepID=UPI0028A2107C|nr:NTTRR-F1 domain [Brevibacillus reuszeri]
MNLIANPGFETGTLAAWQSFNATINCRYVQTGFFSAQLEGGMTNSYIQQIVPVDSNSSYQFVISLAKAGELRAPMMSIFLLFLDAAQNTVSLGFALSMRTLNQPDSNTGAWKTIVESTTVSPVNAAYALLFVHKIPQQRSSPVLIDDIGLYANTGGGGGGMDYTEIRNLLTSYLVANSTIVIMTAGQPMGTAGTVASVGTSIVTFSTLVGSTMTIPLEKITNIETV